MDNTAGPAVPAPVAPVADHAPRRRALPARWARSLSGVIAVLALSGCAVLVHGTTQMVPIDARPEPAEVFVDGVAQGFTPLELRLARGREHTLTLRSGLQTRTVTLTPRVQGGRLALDAAAPVALGVGTVLWCFPPTGTEAATVVRDLGCSLGALLTLGATAPLLVDAGTGALFELTPGEVFVAFE